MAGFYKYDPWAPDPTLLAGPTTSNLMGLDASAPPVAQPATSGFNLGSVGAGLQAMGALTGAIGSFYSAKTQASALRFQSDMASINARIAELGAQSALNRGQKQIGSLTLRAGQLKGSQRAAMAANGIDLGTGSAAETLASTDFMKESDALTINMNSVMDAIGYRTQGVNAGNQALMARATADAIGPFGAMTSSLMGSAGSVAGSWYRYSRTKEGKD